MNIKLVDEISLLLINFKKEKKASNLPVGEHYFEMRKVYKDKIKELTGADVFYTEIEWYLKLFIRVSQLSKRIKKIAADEKILLWIEKTKNYEHSQYRRDKKDKVSYFDESKTSFHTSENVFLAVERNELIDIIKKEYKKCFPATKDALFWDWKNPYRKELLTSIFSLLHPHFSEELNHSLAYLFWSISMESFFKTIAKNEKQKMMYFKEYKEMVKKSIRFAALSNVNKEFDIDQGSKQGSYVLSSFPTPVDGVYYDSRYPNSHFAYFKDWRDGDAFWAKLTMREKMIYSYSGMLFMKEGI